MEKFEEILQQRAIRITPMRQLLLQYFLKSNHTLDLAELENAFPKADRITMYRTLKTFEEKGIIHSIENGAAGIKYALCKEHCTESMHTDYHPHFHCLKCNRISCLETVFIPPVQLPEGYRSQEVNMTIKGICKNCED